MESARTNRVGGHPHRLVALRLIGALLLAIGTGGWSVWFAWRVAQFPGHPLAMLLLVLEVLGVVGGCLIAFALLCRSSSVVSSADVDDQLVRSNPLTFPSALADLLGQPTVSDGVSVRNSARILLDRRTSAVERALLAARLDGIRRLVIVLAVAASLLIGSAPFGRLSPLPLVAAGVGLIATGLGITVLSNGRLGIGSRLRWSFGAMGMPFSVHADLSADEQPEPVSRSWIGVMATIVVLNLAVALRGLSDRWTHGLPAMDQAERGIAMAAALMCVFAAMITLGRLPAPSALDRNVVARRIEEGTARQSALVATALLGAVGFVAGVMPGAASASDQPPNGRGVQRAGIEAVVGVHLPGVMDSGPALEYPIEVTSHASNYD